MSNLQQLYTEIPSIRELVEHLNVNKGFFRSKLSKYLFWIMNACILASLVLACALWSHRSFRTWTFVWIILLWLMFIVWDVVFPNFRMIVHPSRTLAIELDDQRKADLGLVVKLAGLPQRALIERRNHLEFQIRLLERRVNFGRFVGLIGVPLVTVLDVFSGTSTLGISNSRLIVSAALTGIYMQAVLLHFSVEHLHRLSYVLQQCAEQNRGSPLPKGDEAGLSTR